MEHSVKPQTPRYVLSAMRHALYPLRFTMPRLRVIALANSEKSLDFSVKLLHILANNLLRTVSMASYEAGRSHLIPTPPTNDGILSHDSLKGDGALIV